MDGKHPHNIDPRPKRRKDQNNPYKLFTVGINTEEPHCYVSFPDSQGIQICMEISKVLYDTLDQFELNDLSVLNEMDNHFEQSELTEESLSKRATVQQAPLDELVFERLQHQMRTPSRNDSWTAEVRHPDRRKQTPLPWVRQLEKLAWEPA